MTDYDKALERDFLLYEKDIRYLAHKFAESVDYTEEDDLYQIGCEAFIKQYKCFDPNADNTPWDYLWIFVRRAIIQYIRQDDGLIHIPLYISNDVSIEYEHIENEDDFFAERPDESNDILYEEVLNRTTYDLMNDLVEKGLTPKQLKVIRLRYGFEDGREKTLKQVAEELGMKSKQQVQQLEQAALHRLSIRCKSRGLNENVLY